MEEIQPSRKLYASENVADQDRRQQIEACSSSKKVMRLVSNHKFVDGCGSHLLTCLRDRLVVLSAHEKPGSGQGQRISHAVVCLQGVIESAEIERGLFIQAEIGRWKGVGREELVLKIEDLIEQVMKEGSIRTCNYETAERAVMEVLALEAFERSLPITPFERKIARIEKLDNPKVVNILAEFMKGRRGPLLLSYPNPHHLQDLHERRMLCLRQLAANQWDGGRCERKQVCGRLFPEAKLWLVGSDPVDSEVTFLQELEELAPDLGIIVVAIRNQENFSGRKTTLNLKLLDSKAQKSAVMGHIWPTEFRNPSWPKDYISFGTHHIQVPVHQLLRYEDLNLSRVMLDARLERNQDLWGSKTLRGTTLCDAIPLRGVTWKGRHSALGIALGEALGLPVAMNLTYGEGGNTLIGQQASGKPCALVGLDSVAATKAILERDLKRDVALEEIRGAFSFDYGVEDIVFVEQPGDFHLDMCMAFVAPGVVVLNDAVEAYQLVKDHFCEWMNDNNIKDEERVALALKETLQVATERKQLEDLVEKQLFDKFKVVRVPGRYMFREGPGGRLFEVMNFFNFLSFTSSDKDKFVIGMGVLDGENGEFAKIFRSMFKRAKIEVKKFIFLDQKKTMESLCMNGGIACRVEWGSQ